MASTTQFLLNSYSHTPPPTIHLSLLPTVLPEENAAQPISISGNLQLPHLEPDSEITDSISPADLHLCINTLTSSSSSTTSKRAAAAKLRVSAKNHSDNRASIGKSPAITALLPLLHSSDSLSQEHAVTAFLNLSLLSTNTSSLSTPLHLLSLIHVLKSGATPTSKQNAACTLLSLSSSNHQKLKIGESGAIPPLIELLKSSSIRSKHDALATLYRLCEVEVNKMRAIEGGAVEVVMEMVGKGEEKAAVVMSRLAEIEKGRKKIVEGEGMKVVMEAIENGGERVKWFGVVTVELLVWCGEDGKGRSYREMFVEEGGIGSLLLVLQSPTLLPKTRQKVSFLLRIHT